MRPHCSQVRNSLELFLQDEHIITIDKSFKKSELMQWDVASRSEFFDRFWPLEERQALIQSLHKLSRRAMHTKELRAYLAERHYSDRAIEYALQELMRLGTLNDNEYEAQFVKRLQRQGKSRREIIYKANQRGITPYALDEHLAPEEETLHALIQKRYPILLDKAADFAKRQKALQALVRRGFSYTAITKVTNNDNR